MMLKSREISDKLDATFISTYHPTICGIATFTHNLFSSITKIDSSIRTNVVAINQENKYRCDSKFPEVILRIERDKRQRYVDLAETINKSSTNIVCIQHEFGIFGGVGGSYFLDFLEQCEKPIVTVFHTLNRNLNQIHHDILRKITEKSDAVVALLPIYSEYLTKICKANSNTRIEFIPHGIPEIPHVNKVAAKSSLGLSNKIVMTSFGLINPNKGLEYAVEALPNIVARYPNTVYIILGQTHPNVLSKYGDVYRKKLERRIQELGLEGNVRFVNSFLSEDYLSLYLSASDIYLAPYLNPYQTSSGCLAYALAHGMAAISTPYPHSQYEISDSNGIIIPSHNSLEITNSVNWLLDRPAHLEKLQKNTIERMITRRWSYVATQYIDLFKLVQNDMVLEDSFLIGGNRYSNNIEHNAVSHSFPKP
jgi:glycosyltransferase involved in cell wall biosynthesis